MASRSSESAIRHVQALFDLGAAGTLTDGELLDRFLGGPGPAAEEAFGALVVRHGPMVLGVCRWALRDRQDTEDAYQATFLVLARKAGSIRRRDSLGTWLYGVARKVAARARLDAARRRAEPARLAERSPARADPGPGPTPAEDHAILHEEIGRLPARYRDPVVLCYLEGMTYDTAARSLRATEGAIRGRLARARDLLRGRLERRGVSHHLAALAAPLGPGRAPAALIEATTRAAIGIAAGPIPAGAASAPAIHLMEGALKTMTFANWKIAASAAALTLGVLGLGACVLAQGQGGPEDPRPPAVILAQAAAPVAAKPDDKSAAEVDPALAKLVPGRVVRDAPLTKDNMVLAHIPDWAFGHVDNIGIANSDGGVRTLLDWPAVPPDEANAPDRRFYLALYARQTTTKGKAGPIVASEVARDWPERTSWKTQPEFESKPAATFDFEPGEGWKLFDVTPLVRARAKDNRPGHGIVLRFQREDRPGAGAWSGYQFVSREGVNEWEPRLPLLLVVEPARK